MARFRSNALPTSHSCGRCLKRNHCPSVGMASHCYEYVPDRLAGTGLGLFPWDCEDAADSGQRTLEPFPLPIVAQHLA